MGFVWGYREVKQSFYPIKINGNVNNLADFLHIKAVNHYKLGGWEGVPRKVNGSAGGSPEK